MLGVIHLKGGSPGDPEGLLAATAFASPIAIAGVLSLLGVWRGLPAITAASGLGVIPMCLVSFVMLPLLVPASLLVAYGLSPGTVRAKYEAQAGFVVGIGLVGAFFLLLVHLDPVTWSSQGGSGSSSDIITDLEAVASLSVVAVVFVAAMLIPRRR